MIDDGPWLMDGSCQDMMVSRAYKVETFLDDGEVEGIKDDLTI